ncbi:hypothetical protein, partial [Vibrio cholerae]|uniref:hypothetical protein n=1 Tax=Vibrio cholerae TaxID=666 RepID=UPI0019D39F33
MTAFRVPNKFWTYSYHAEKEHVLIQAEEGKQLDHQAHQIQSTTVQNCAHSTLNEKPGSPLNAFCP